MTFVMRPAPWGFDGRVWRDIKGREIAVEDLTPGAALGARGMLERFAATYAAERVGFYRAAAAAARTDGLAATLAAELDVAADRIEGASAQDWIEGTVLWRALTERIAE
ncbi:hypothetical protein DDP54_10455 [Cellulomonas sp. WB94]|uniref:hypothetical protein n=1 Tax=Cellulomonas sp. WB94 TaxID=2173174 RepID=UPI000D570422|nr:hypothetical protein [Cellulomonas sp. WB94]PVU83345.1 hypothetical protein DDP54_10455 [Cellulomonas sp. WB94]